jgi:hypothetical protein
LPRSTLEHGGEANGEKHQWSTKHTEWRDLELPFVKTSYKMRKGCLVAAVVPSQARHLLTQRADRSKVPATDGPVLGGAHCKTECGVLRSCKIGSLFSALGFALPRPLSSGRAHVRSCQARQVHAAGPGSLGLAMSVAGRSGIYNTDLGSIDTSRTSPRSHGRFFVLRRQLSSRLRSTASKEDGQCQASQSLRYLPTQPHGSVGWPK